MKQDTRPFARRNVRAYLAGLLSYLLILGHMTPLAMAAGRPAPRTSPPADVARESKGETRRTEAAPAPLAAPAMALAPLITATKVDTYPGQPLPANPGATITYTITIRNDGPDPATNLTLTDMVDENTTIVPGSAVATPIAIDETYNVLGNVRIAPNAAGGLLANDNNPIMGGNSGLTATGPTTGPSNGQVTVNSDGSFSYNPNPGFTGTDSFTYTITNGDGRTDTGNVMLNVSGMLWFVNTGAGAGGDGRLSSPFNCLVGAGCFDSVAADDPGDNIFVYTGTYNNAGALTLLNNQKVIGQAATGANLQTVAGVTLPPHSDLLPELAGGPVTINSTGSGIVVTTGNTNTLRGFTLGNNGAGAKIFSTAFGTLNVSEVALTGTGQALNLDSGALAATFTSIGSTTSAGQGISLDQVTGSLTSTGGTTITDPATQGILVTASTADLNFGNTTVSDATDAISLQNNSAGTRTFGTLTTTGGTGVGFLHANGGGTVNVTGATSITNPTGNGIDIDASNANLTFAGTTVNKGATGNTGVDLTNNTGRIITFSSLAVTTTGAFAINTNVGGTFNVTNAAGSSLTQSGAGGGAATFTNTTLGVNFTTVSSNGGGNGIIFSGGSGTFNSGTTNLQNNAGIGLAMTSSGVAANFGNTTVNSSAGDAVDLSSNTANITFADLDLTPDTNLRGLDAQNNTGTITSTSGDIATNGAAAVFIDGPAGRTPLALVLSNVDSTGSADNGINLTDVSGNFTVNDGTLATSIINPTGAGIQVRNTASGGTMNFGITSITSSAAAGNAVVLGTAGNGNAGNVTFPTLTIGVSTASRYSGVGVSITDGASTSTVSLGTLNIFTNNQSGLAATNFDGTLNATSGTVDTGTGASVNIDGPAGLTTLGVSLTRVVSAAGTTPGITVRDTNGTFAVVGSGGACTSAATCTGGSISGKTGSSETTGTPGVRIANVTNFRLTRVNISGNNHSGIYGGIVANPSGAIDPSTINGFQLDTCNITGNGNDTVSNPDETGVDLYNVVGTAAGGSNPTSITNTTISNNHEFQLQVTNASATALTNFQLSGNTISSNGAGAIANLFNFLATSTANMTLNVASGTFTGNAPNTATGVNCDSSGTATLACNVSGGTFTNNNVAVTAAPNGASNLAFVIQNTISTGNRAHGLNLFVNANSTGPVNGRFLNNTVGTVGVDDSGALLGIGIRVQNEGVNTSNPVNVLVQGNTVQEVASFQGINVNQGISGEATSKPTNVTILNNIVRNIDDSRGIVVSSNNNTNTTGSAGTTCADISGNELNTIAGQVGDGSKIRVAGLAGGTFNVRQTSAADLAAQNSPPVGVATTTTTTAQISVRTPVNFNAGTCTQPTNGPVSFDDSAMADPGDVPNVQGAPASAPVAAKATPRTTLTTTTAPAVKAPAPVQPRTASFLKTATVETKSNEPVETKPALSVQTRPGRGPGKKGPGTGKPDAPTLTPGTDPPALNPPVINGDQLTWNIGTLPANTTVTITFQVIVDAPFTGSAPRVLNQGTITADGGISAVTDDPDNAAGSNDPTVTPINSVNVRVNNAQVAEPPTGMTDMMFAVTLSGPAPGTVSMNYATANGTATAGACGTPGADYVSTNGTLTFATGEQVKTINVPVCADAVADDGETFTLTLSGVTGGTLLDGEATGTITANTPGEVLISELRTFGPGGSNDANDEFVEIYNNSPAVHTVSVDDGSAGYGLFVIGADCNAAPVLVGTIPNGTVIPARGHYLFTGSAYSLANYGGTGAAAGNLTLASGIPSNGNVAIFKTNNVLNLGTANRLDAVGFGTNTSGVCNLLREGTTLTAATNNLTNLGQYTYFRDMRRNVGAGNPNDTNDNSVDFLFADPNGTEAGPTLFLGVAGPENLASPIRRDVVGNAPGINLELIDRSKHISEVPNRERAFDSDPGNNSTFGTLTIRRRLFNNTGGNVTRLRFRVVEMTTLPVGTDIADLRTRTSVMEASVGPVGDGTTCGAAPMPCNVTVQPTTLDMPPAQALGAGFNSSLSVGAITLATPLANGASMNVNFLLGIEKTGDFRFLITIEALP